MRKSEKGFASFRLERRDVGLGSRSLGVVATELVLCHRVDVANFHRRWREMVCLDSIPGAERLMNHKEHFLRGAGIQNIKEKETCS